MARLGSEASLRGPPGWLMLKVKLNDVSLINKVTQNREFKIREEQRQWLLDGGETGLVWLLRVADIKQPKVWCLQCSFKRRAVQVQQEKSGIISLRENPAMEMTILTGAQAEKLRRGATGVQAEKTLLVPSQRSPGCVKAAGQRTEVTWSLRKACSPKRSIQHRHERGMRTCGDLCTASNSQPCCGS